VGRFRSAAKLDGPPGLSIFADVDGVTELHVAPELFICSARLIDVRTT
jgi:hypothetical protein